MSIDDEKRQLRRSVKSFLMSLADGEIASRSAVICDNIAKLDEFKNARVVMLYMPLKGEVDVTGLIRKVFETGKTACFPVITEKGHMIAAKADSLEDMLPDKYGIPSPTNGTATAPDSIDVIITPGLAFDRRGGRLGKGGGFYDRFLAETSAVTIAPAFVEQVVDEIPRMEFDRKIDILVCENGATVCGE
ncbi:MAG: 5-formyltetrahydrofolate cyclo-ligase [Clostridia bacterium]|nr:5-formyltetrahydrofolate cyclo-ligase [Clostridia bacterium]